MHDVAYLGGPGPCGDDSRVPVSDTTLSRLLIPVHGTEIPSHELSLTEALAALRGAHSMLQSQQFQFFYAMQAGSQTANIWFLYNFVTTPVEGFWKTTEAGILYSTRMYQVTVVNKPSSA